MVNGVPFRPWTRPVAFALAASALLLAGPAAVSAPHKGSTVSGGAAVIDGDTLEIGSVRVRLEGIDAPELAQTCGRAWIGTWRCGDAAARELSKLVSAGPVTCTVEGHDKYGRVLGLCSAGGTDINATMVRTGYAWAFVKYSAQYTSEEEAARGEKAGIWAGPAEPAWEYRAGRWKTAGADAPYGCAIKGNISSGGRIYHMPWSPWYQKVKVEAGKGERWFCSEAEASAAGFRAAYAP